MNLRIISGLILFQFLGTNVQLTAQDCDTTIYEVVEKMPEYPGGWPEFYKYVGKIQYPLIADSCYLTSKLYFQFIVNCDGSISDLKPLMNSDHPYSKIILRHLQQMPNWKPGEEKNQLVPVRLIIPVRLCFLN
ncbi:MAG: hypothetical protein H6600_05240 [Flavobacteriales bacterium]|nr:hypothetical protein [Flavobacteriales bacterium]